MSPSLHKLRFSLVQKPLIIFYVLGDVGGLYVVTFQGQTPLLSLPSLHRPKKDHCSSYWFLIYPCAGNVVCEQLLRISKLINIFCQEKVRVVK